MTNFMLLFFIFTESHDIYSTILKQIFSNFILWFLWKIIVKFKLIDLIIFLECFSMRNSWKSIMICEFALFMLVYGSHMAEVPFGWINHESLVCYTYIYVSNLPLKFHSHWMCGLRENWKPIFVGQNFVPWFSCNN